MLSLEILKEFTRKNQTIERNIKEFRKRTNRF